MDALITVDARKDLRNKNAIVLHLRLGGLFKLHDVTSTYNETAVSRTTLRNLGYRTATIRYSGGKKTVQVDL